MPDNTPIVHNNASRARAPRPGSAGRAALTGPSGTQGPRRCPRAPAWPVAWLGAARRAQACGGGDIERAAAVDHHRVLLSGEIDADLAFAHVLEHGFGGTQQGIAEPAAARLLVHD